MLHCSVNSFLFMDKNWKAFERRVALRTGGERIPVSDRRTPLDVAHPYLGIECKYRRKLSKFIKMPCSRL